MDYLSWEECRLTQRVKLVKCIRPWEQIIKMEDVLNKDAWKRIAILNAPITNIWIVLLIRTANIPFRIKKKKTAPNLTITEPWPLKKIERFQLQKDKIQCQQFHDFHVLSKFGHFWVVAEPHCSLTHFRLRSSTFYVSNPQIRRRGNTKPLMASWWHQLQAVHAT